MYKKFFLAVVAGLFLVTAQAKGFGQEFRATVTGTVTDSSKAVIPNATITVRNLDTGETMTAKSNAAGVYIVPYLQPGQKLEVSAEAPGFAKSTYPPVVLTISQTQTADFALKIGSAAEQITVNSQSYQVGLDTEKGDRGIVIDNKTITELPLNGRNPLSLLDEVAGVTNEAGPGVEGPATNSYNISFFSVNGGLAQNTEYTIDGMPDNAIPWYSSGPSAVPSVDAIQEFKVITNPYDAQFGRTAGGVVSMELKSGTNQLHGSAYEFAKRGYLDANSWFNNYYGQNRPGHTEDQYGFELGGPVFIPKLYDGRNKTFFMFNLERFKQVLPQAMTFDMPSPQWLQGDFSNFVDQSGALIPVFDPSTATTANPTRKIFQNAGQYNHINPSRFNPIAVNALNLMLATAHPTNVSLPNQLPWESIWVDTIPQTANARNYILKVDQSLGSKDHLSGNFIHDYNTLRQLSTPPGVWENSENFTEVHLNFGVDWVHTFRSNLLFDVHASYQRYWRQDGSPAGWNYNPTQLGFPQALVNQLPLKLGFPQISFNMQQQSAATGNGYNNWLAMSRDRYFFPSDNESISPALTWNKGKHNIRTGLDFRITHAVQNVSWTNSIEISTNGQATSEYWNRNNTNDIATLPDGTPLSQSGSGNAILDFLIGQPNSVQVTNQLNPYYTWHYYAPWVQDDWKVTPKFTLNLGFRYDLNGPPTARHDWLNTGFNPNVVNPVNALINHGLYPGTVKGGITFPGTSGTNLPWARDLSKWQPRLGFAWLALPSTVLRGGIGRMIMSPMGNEPTSAGFQNNPIYNNSPDGGRTYFADNLGNPFPQGIPSIPGASLGLMTNVGNGISFINPQYKLPSVIQASLGVQQAMPHDGKLEISYVGSRSYDQDATYYDYNVNHALYRSCNALLGTPSNPDPRTQCQNLTANPFYGVPGVEGGLGVNQQISLQHYASPFPQFNSITETQNNWGRYWYNSLQTTYQQRLDWEQINASWTWSKTMMSNVDPGNSGDGYIDEEYLIPVRSIAPTDRQNRITLTSVLNVPIGRRLKYFGNMNRGLDAVVGGWEVGSDFFWETGQPLYLSSGYNLSGNIKGPKRNVADTIDLGVNQCVDLWYDSNGSTPGYYSLYTANGASQASCSGKVGWQQVASYGPHTTQQYTDQLRAPGTNQLDVNLAKTFKFGDRISMQVRMEEQNVLNHPTWYYGVDTNPTDTNFGTVNKPEVGQSNTPRYGQIGVKVLW